ncbi:MAG TPA: hypothetical protein VJ439_00905 [Candidatus Bathyarchaeia archaeon]|nr:hypothetical protein [Candidatus Bathyarchaeia archaeon]
MEAYNRETTPNRDRLAMRNDEKSPAYVTMSEIIAEVNSLKEQLQLKMLILNKNEHTPFSKFSA